MTSAYVDTSALAKRYLREPGSAEFDRWFIDAVPVDVSVLATVELSSTLRKCQRSDRLSANDVLAIEAVFAADLDAGCIRILDMPPGVFHVAKTLVASHAVHGLRTLDALQLAAALESGASTFVTADGKLAGAAAASGLHVLSFGQPAQP